MPATGLAMLADAGIDLDGAYDGSFVQNWLGGHP